MTILLIEHNNGLGAAMVQALVAAGFVVDWQRSFEAAHALAVEHHVDLIVMARGLPDRDGVDAVRLLRGQGVSTPLLMISERDRIADRVAGLDAGSDDYLVKPFAFDELIARCRALLRRSPFLEPGQIRLGNLELKPETLELTVNEAPLSITRREGQLLVALLRRAGRVCTRTYLEAALYDVDAAVSPNALETNISRLRALLASARARVELKTIRGVGYALTAATE